VQKEISYKSARQGGICVSVAKPNTEQAITEVRQLQQAADVIEIRLDTMQSYDVHHLCREIDHPLLFTNRPLWEGGQYKGPEEERITPLLEAIGQKAAFIDLELRADLPSRQKLLDSLQGSETQLIISYHDFAGTPDHATLSTILQQQMESGAQIGKIVTMAHSPADTLRILHLLDQAGEKDFPLIAFCMGDAGKLSRIITLLLGGFLTYAALDERQATAPGQLSVQRLNELLTLLA